MTIEEASGPPVELWTCNADAVNTFVSMTTQWTRDLDGKKCCLNYEALPFVMKMMGVSRKDQPDVFQDIRIMEDEALAAMREG